MLLLIVILGVVLCRYSVSMNKQLTTHTVTRTCLVQLRLVARYVDVGMLLTLWCCLLSNVRMPRLLQKSDLARRTTTFYTPQTERIVGSFSWNSITPAEETLMKLIYLLLRWFCSEYAWPSTDSTCSGQSLYNNVVGSLLTFVMMFPSVTKFVYTRGHDAF